MGVYKTLKKTAKRGAKPFGEVVSAFRTVEKRSNPIRGIRRVTKAIRGRKK